MYLYEQIMHTHVNAEFLWYTCILLPKKLCPGIYCVAFSAVSITILMPEQLILGIKCLVTILRFVGSYNGK